MNLLFTGFTNRPYNMVMAGVFKWPNASKDIHIMADSVTFSITELDEDEEIEGLEEEDELYRFSMLWRGCYIYDGSDPSKEWLDVLYYFTPYDVKKFDGVLFTDFYFHHDAPEDYKVWFDSYKPVI